VLAAGTAGQRLIACHLADMADEAEPRQLVTDQKEMF
jgi:hypothetical protein